MDWKEYSIEIIKVVFNWPVTGTILLLIFIFTFKEAIRALLQGLFLKKLYGAEFGERQSDIDERMEKQTLSAESKIVKPEVKKAIHPDCKDDAEFHEFRFFDFALANSTRLALQLINAIKGMTREYFMANVSVAPGASDVAVEREAIFNALLANELVVLEGGVYKATEKGARYLKFSRLS
jgi:hypothetical protein